ncbi:MAG: hypothetical protein ACTSR2_14395, partial [Candidatus Hodarchaeales archaeon]
MKQKKNLMVLTLALVASLLMTTWAVQASGISLSKFSNANVKGVQLQTRKRVATPKMAVIQKTPTIANMLTTAQITKFVDYSEDIQPEEVTSEILSEIDTLVAEYEQ